MSGVTLEKFRPESKLEIVETHIEKPKFPVIDAHNHLSEAFGGGWCDQPVDNLLSVLDEADVRHFVDLDGGWGETILEHRLKKFKDHAPERFIIFGGVAWEKWSEHGTKFPEWAAKRLETQVSLGAQGLKVWKPFGLSVRDHQGALVRVDDERLDLIWQQAAALKIPVLVHVGDPVAFFEPLDATNERYEELQAHPDWQFPSPPYPSFEFIINGFANLVRRHPETTFIGAHVGCYAENLAWVSNLLDSCPNLYVDISGRINELGRQPYTSRRFFLQHSDRILFGLDEPASIDRYQLYYRFLETQDEYFSYSFEENFGQGRWRIYGLTLPDEVLQKVYFQNARQALNLVSSALGKSKVETSERGKDFG